MSALTQKATLDIKDASTDDLQANLVSDEQVSATNKKPGKPATESQPVFGCYHGVCLNCCEHPCATQDRAYEIALAYVRNNNVSGERAK
ncbi:hypothetical protein ACFQ14_12580 [Pseudahrensia aquimaris]|uniref:Uncharacterized protein n=1 Tax=Pseudahrensia aquimaris TaxID=744461 RepID=A0ABW3FHL7_9HYPH